GSSDRGAKPAFPSTASGSGGNSGATGSSTGAGHCGSSAERSFSATPSATRPPIPSETPAGDSTSSMRLPPRSGPNTYTRSDTVGQPSIGARNQYAPASTTSHISSRSAAPSSLNAR